MDMKIAGAGMIGAGEYDDISISGAASVQGNVSCKSFRCSGSVQCSGAIDCAGDLRVSGAVKMNGSLTAGAVHVSGAFAGETLRAAGEVKLSGGAKLGGDLAGRDVRASGGLKVGGGIEAENFVLSGSLDCEGLLNAEHAEIRLHHAHSTVQAIGGAEVVVKPNEDAERRQGFFKSLFNVEPKTGSLTVREWVEADDVDLTNTACPLVTGSRVTVGPGCRIGTVRYRDTLTVDPSATVGSSEKI